jgi:hypothetical protein
MLTFTIDNKQYNLDKLINLFGTYDLCVIKEKMRILINFEVN